MVPQPLSAAAPVQNVLGMRHLNRLTPDSGLGLITEVTVPPGLGAPLHSHDVDAEFFLVFDGELTVELDGTLHRLRAGESCHLPVGSRHAFRNEGHCPARFLAVISPGFDAYAFFTAMDGIAPGDMLDPAKLIALGKVHKLAFA